jgi:hypothetical protein
MTKNKQNKKNKSVKSNCARATIIAAIIGFLGTIAGALIQYYSNVIPSKTNLWSITGCLKLEDSDEFNNKDILLSIIPPDQVIDSNGRFFIDNVPLKIDHGKPSLLIKKDGYKFLQLLLTDRSPPYHEEANVPNYSIKYNKNKKEIDVGKVIILERERIQ